MAAWLTDILAKSLLPSAQDQQEALQFLENAAAQNFGEYVRQLSEILHNTDADDSIRQQAGLQLKNALDARDHSLLEAKAARWLQTPEEIRSLVKKNTFESLGTESRRPSTAAQCVSRLTCIELPTNLWPNVISDLMVAVTDQSSTANRREACLEALGYICESIQPVSCLLPQANNIITAIVHGMKREEPSDHVRLAATRALTNSLSFFEANFNSLNERNIIMQVVCEATQAQNVEVKKAALECLVSIVATYYVHMEAYMRPALFPIVLDAMRSNDEDVALQGIEFWTSICEVEIALQDEAKDAEEAGETPEHVSKYYAQGAAEIITPILCQRLCQQEEDADEDEWNVSKSASVCIGMLAQTIGDAAVNLFIPFITQNIMLDDWRNKEAALMAFGAILDGPDPNTLSGLVGGAMPYLVAALAHPKAEVRDTAAWTIGRACDVCQETVVQEPILRELLPALASGLTHEPRVAANVCWALSSLTQAAYNVASARGENTSKDQPRTYILSGCFKAMVDQLIHVTERPDANQSNLRISAFEALMEMMRHSPEDCYSVVQETTAVILAKIEQLLAMESQLSTSSERQQYLDLQSLLCNMLSSVLARMEPADAERIAQPCMNAIMLMIQRSGDAIMDDALQAMTTLIQTLGKAFAPYLEKTLPLIVNGLRNREKADICIVSIGIVTDLCRAFETEIGIERLDEIMQLMREMLLDNQMDNAVHPLVLSAFGDIALAMGPNFERYIDGVLQVLAQASQAQITSHDDVDHVDYVMQLRENCLEAYTGIIASVKPPKGQESNTNACLPKVQQHVLHIVELLARLASEPLPDSVVAAAVGLVGDMCSTFGVPMLQYLDNEPINKLLNRSRRAKSNKAKSLGNYALKEMRKLRNMTTNTTLGLQGVRNGGSLADG